MDLGRTAGQQDGVVTLHQALGAGMSRAQVRGAVVAGRWLRLDRCAYLIRDLAPAEPRRAAIRAAVLSLGRDAVAVYDTAAELHGIAGLRPGGPIHVGLPGVLAKRRRPDAVCVHQLSLPPTGVCRVGGIPLTTPLRTVADLVCRTHRYAAVSLLDSALNRRLLRPDDMAAVAAMVRGRRGAVAARDYLLEADGRAQSPLETRMRLRCADGGVPPDDLQFEIRDPGGLLLGIADAVWRRQRVAAEADGESTHGHPEAVFKDRWRQNRLVNEGWTVLRFTWADTLRRDIIPAAVRAALSRPR